jgi:hypothetical protein
MKKWILSDYSEAELLELYADVLDELQLRGVTHSTNNPVANYSEKLAKETLDLKLMPESTKGYDAVDLEGKRYEIKGRRPTSKNASRQLSMLRGLDKQHFDYLVGIIFRENFEVHKGCIIPHRVVLEKSRYTNHANAWIFILNDDVWHIAGVRDITKELKAKQGGQQINTADR